MTTLVIALGCFSTAVFVAVFTKLHLNKLSGPRTFHYIVHVKSGRLWLSRRSLKWIKIGLITFLAGLTFRVWLMLGKWFACVTGGTFFVFLFVIASLDAVLHHIYLASRDKKIEGWDSAKFLDNLKVPAPDDTELVLWLKALAKWKF